MSEVSSTMTDGSCLYLTWNYVPRCQYRLSFDQFCLQSCYVRMQGCTFHCCCQLSFETIFFIVLQLGFLNSLKCHSNYLNFMHSLFCNPQKVHIFAKQ